MGKTVWIVNPYGTLPAEDWSTYRSTMLAECLSAQGYEVTQFISNFEHRSKTFRAEGSHEIESPARYCIEVVASTAYRSHISLDRVRYERTFARRLLAIARQRLEPDVVILAEPALFYYDIILRRLHGGGTALVLDVIDLWPELFALVIPRILRPASGVLLAPLYYWRRRLYQRADAVVAVARDYLEVASALTRPHIPLEVAYWSFDERKDAADPIAASDEGIVQKLVGEKRPEEVWALYAGTLGENYDIRAIVAASRQLASAPRGRAAVKFIVAGDGPLASYCRANESEHFVFVGRVGARELAVLYRHADIALSTYRGESTVAFPIKAFDYLRYGLPMVNSLGRDIGALIREHHVGINYDPADRRSLFAAVERLASDPLLRAQMGDNARRLSCEFSRERQYGRFVRVLEAVAQRGASTQ
jgi:glycosyltransferase involved in cell wall biosynthesis